MNVSYNFIETYKNLKLMYPKIYEELDRDFNISEEDPNKAMYLIVYDSLEDYAYHVYYEGGLVELTSELHYGPPLAEAIDFQKVGEAIKKYIEENPDDYRVEELYVTSDNKVVENSDWGD